MNIAAVLGELGTVYRERIVEMRLFETYEIYVWSDVVPTGKDKKKKEMLIKQIAEELPDIHVKLASKVSEFSQGFRLGIAHRPTRSRDEVASLIGELRGLLRPGDAFRPYALELASVVESHLSTLAEPYEYKRMVKERAKIAKERADIQEREAAEVDKA